MSRFYCRENELRKLNKRYAGDKITKKETPITEKPGKKTIYLLADNFFRFWYRFVPVILTEQNSTSVHILHMK